MTCELSIRPYQPNKTRKESGNSFPVSVDNRSKMADYDLNISYIAEALGVSRSTTKRRLREYEISISERQTDIPDAELDSVVRNIHTEFPNAGYRRMQSQLTVRGINVSQMRVRASMQRTDPEGVAMRWLPLTPRAVYRVSGPLAL